MTYRERITPWVVVRLLPNMQRVVNWAISPTIGRGRTFTISSTANSRWNVRDYLRLSAFRQFMSGVFRYTKMSGGLRFFCLKLNFVINIWKTDRKFKRVEGQRRVRFIVFVKLPLFIGCFV